LLFTLTGSGNTSTILRFKKLTTIVNFLKFEFIIRS